MIIFRAAQFCAAFLYVYLYPMIPSEQPAAKGLGKLYMIPVPLAPEALHTLPEAVKKQSCTFRFYFVENIRTARRHLKSIDKSVDIDAIEFSEINSQTPPDLALLRKWLKAGHDVGMMSEAGCPGVADPGSTLAAAAQEIG